ARGRVARGGWAEARDGDGAREPGRRHAGGGREHRPLGRAGPISGGGDPIPGESSAWCARGPPGADRGASGSPETLVAQDLCATARCLREGPPIGRIRRLSPRVRPRHRTSPGPPAWAGPVGGSLATRKNNSIQGDGGYTSADITVLEGVEHVRLRPGMYIGTTGPRGLHHLVYEVVDNSIDEAMAGYCDRIRVTLHADGSCTVEDNGRGIPVKPIPKAKDRRPAIEVVLTTLNAGGKFGGGGYRISGGLHGVGVSVVNALAERLLVEVQRDGFNWSQEYSRGKAIKRLARAKPTTKTGTTVTFWPDTEVFEETTFKREVLAERLQELAFLNEGVEIQLVDEREDKPLKEVFKASG